MRSLFSRINQEYSGVSNKHFMARRLLWFCQVALSAIIGILVFGLIFGLMGTRPTNLVYWMAIAGSLVVTIGLMVWVDKILNSRFSCSALTVLSQKRKMNWIGKHPTLIGVLLTYLLVSLVGAVVYRIVMSEAKAASDGLFLGFLWILFFPSEVVLLVTGVIMAFLLDRHQLREKLSMIDSDSTVKVNTNKTLLISIVVPALFLYVLFFPLYVRPAMSKMVFEVTASPQVKLNKEFAHELNIFTDTSVGYNKNIIYDFVGRGADINTDGEHGTPLSFAARAGDAEFVKDLLAKGAVAKQCSASDQELIEKLTKQSSTSSTGN